MTRDREGGGMCKHNASNSNLSMPMLGILVGMAMVAAPVTYAGGWLKKALNAQPAQNTYASQNQRAYLSDNLQASVSRFDLRLNVTQARAGSPVQAVADLVVNGSHDVIRTVALHYKLIDSRGKVRSQVTKTIDNFISGQSFESTINFTPPIGIPHGRYWVDVDLLINGARTSTTSAEYAIL